MNEEVLWTQFLDKIKNELSSISYNTWFAETKLYKIKDNKATFIVPMPIYKNQPERGREEAGCRRVLARLYWERPSELPHRRSSSSAPRRDSTEPRPRGCSVPGEPPQALPSF